MKNLFLILVLFFYSHCYSFSQVPVDSLVGYWKFDGNANDYSTYSNHGNLLFGTSFTSDRHNDTARAVVFDKTSLQYVGVPITSSLKVNDELTISFWAKRRTYGNGVVDQVINRGGDWNQGKCNYGLVFSDNTLVFIHNNGYHGVAVPGIPSNLLIPYSGPYGSTLPGVPMDTLWHHYVISTKNGSDLVNMWVDTLLVPTFWDGNSRIIDFKFANSEDLTIGGGGPHYTNNVLDDVRLYRKKYAQTEVNKLYHECLTNNSSINASACYSYTAPDGKTHTTSGIKKAIIPVSKWCTDTITINLTITIPDSTVTKNGFTLTSSSTSGKYQWLNCDSNYAPLPNDTLRVFTAKKNGNYAVEVTQNGCKDTSACINVFGVGLPNDEILLPFSIYPNPSEGSITLDNLQSDGITQVTIFSLLGVEISTYRLDARQKVEIPFDVKPGIYLACIKSADENFVMKLVKPQ